jgi:ribose transport system ATP-binding protein
MDEIFALGDRVTVIRDGETVATKRIAETDAAEVIRLMVGGEQTLVAAEPHQPTTVAATARTVLAVNGLSGDGFRAVSFNVAAGEILGLGGLHGQGQSTVLRALFGATPPTSGTVQLNGERLTPSSPRATIARGLAYVSGDRRRDGVIAGRPILENVTPVHALKQKLALATPSSLKARATPALEALRTKFATFGHPISSLSGGNQQKIVIARWLIDRPDVLLLDDPTKGIDLSAKTDLFQLIRKLAAEGMAIVLYSSEDAELLGNADRILVFNGGSVTRALTGDERTPFNLYQAAYEAGNEVA